MSKVDNNWRGELKATNYDAYIRFCECISTTSDFILMCKLLKKYNSTMGVEDCVLYMWDWIQSNSQWKLSDWIDENFDEIVWNLRVGGC